MVSDAVLSDEARETRAVEPPPYRPGRPDFEAGFWYARQQAAEIVGNMAYRKEAMTAYAAILAMRPKPPTAPAAGELRDYPIGHPVAGDAP
jgi:hypothetical protein